MSEDSFLRQLRADPDDRLARDVFADWLEEQGDPRGELLRLSQHLTQPGRATSDRSSILRGRDEDRLRALVRRGIKPVGPYWTNSIGIQFAWVPAGTFLIGSPADEPLRQDDEVAHEVTLSRGLYFSLFPVTQEQWRHVTGESPSLFRGDHRPVEGVSWNDCRQFCEALCKREGLTGDGPTAPYRLPTEAEWEYACRAGTTSPYFTGATLETTQGNYHAHYLGRSGRQGPYRQETTPLGTFPGNAFGLQDMHGNVFEWCQDDYAGYRAEPAVDPVGRSTGEVKVLRGGSWHSLVARCRSACRGWSAVNYRGSDVGCRVCFQLAYDFHL